MPELTKVMIIRHGEKPTIKNQPPFGVTPDGEQDWESLTVRGWLRAAGLGRLFNPTGNQFPNDAHDRPVSIYASAPRHPGVALEQDEASKSKRPLQTITPLAQELTIAPILNFGKGQEAALAKQILARSGVILISWQHEAIVEIARYLVASHEPKATIPAKWPNDRFDIAWIFDPPVKGKSRWKFTQGFASHCDIVISRDRGRISVIGGNVDHAVTMKHIPVTTDGRLADSGDSALDRRYHWFVVLRILYAR